MTLVARPVNADADATRARILESAHHLFATQGVASTTIRDVAKRAGVSLAMVHHYYGSKEQLYGACVDAMYIELVELRAELEGKLVGATSLDDLLVRAVAQSYDFARRHRDAVRLMIRTTVDAGELTATGRDFHLSFLDGISHTLSSMGAKRPDELRLPLQTLVFLIARYAVQNEGELLRVVDRKSAKEAHAAVARHLVDVARALVTPLGERERMAR